MQILSASGSAQTLNSLIYDFSGSSYHYNSDFTAGARTFTATPPVQSTISKSFTPTSILVTGTSTLAITINNPNTAAVTGYNFTDALPTNVSVAAVPVIPSGCGTPTFTSAPSVPLAVNATTIIGANIDVAAGSSCTMQVPVKASATGIYDNTITALNFSGGVASNTATLTVGNSISGETPTGCAGQRAACWYFPTGFSITNPVACTGGGTPYFGTADLGGGFPTTTSNSNAPSSPGGSSWEQNGGIPSTLAAAITNNDFFRFQFNTNSIPVMTLRWAAERANNGNAPTRMAIYAGGSGTGSGSQGTLLDDIALTTAWVRGTRAVTLANGLKPTGITEFRFYPYSASSENAGADSFIDDVEFFVCLPPPFTKAFSPTPVNVGQTSRLTFTIRNTNVVDAEVPITPVATNPVLTGVQFTDALPTGMLIAGTPNVQNNGNCGSPTVTADANAGTITVTGATIQPNSTCTISVNVVTSVAGPLVNTSSAIRSAETGSNTGLDGTATATQVSIVPPTIEKGFVPSEIPAGGTSRLSLYIQNPNPDHAIRGVAVTDTLPAGVLVADSPNPQRSGCDASSTPTITATANTNSIAVSGASIAAGGTCTITVSVKAAVAGTYDNVIGTGAGNNGVRHVVTGISGDETFYSADGAAATLVVRAPNPSISFVKEVGTSASGPWFPYLAIPLAGEVDVFYRFTVENTGDVALTKPAAGFVVDPLITGEEACTWPASLPVAVAANDDHIASCVVGPIDAVFPGLLNTATATGIHGPNPLTDIVTDIDSAEYKIANISVAKSVSPTVFTASNQTLTYTIRVENVGSAPLDGWNYGLFPRFSDPLTPDGTESCEAINTVGDFDAIFDPGEVLNCTAQYVTTAGDVAAGVVTNTALVEFQQFGRPSNELKVYYNPDDTSPFLLVNKSMSANPLPGANASYTITVTNAGAVDTSGNLVISDLLPANVTYNTLLGTTGSSTGWGCNAPVNEGSNPVRQRMTCTYSGTALLAGGGAGSTTSLVLNVVLGLTASNVSNTATVTGGGDPGCVDPTPAARCSGTVTASTLPVVLSYVESQVEGGQLRVRFGTSVEAGTLGFRVIAGNADPAGQRPLDARLVEANGFTFKPQQYEVSGAYTGQTEIWIEEQTTRGESTRFGPYPVGVTSGSRDQPVATDWVAIQAEQQAFRAAQLQTLRSVRSGQALEAEVGVRRSGWVRIRHEDLLAQGIDWSGIEASRLALSQGLRPIPLQLEGPAVFGPGSVLAFYGEQVEGSLYTDARVYRLRVSETGHAAMDRVSAAPVADVAVQRSTRTSYVHAPNTLYHFASVTEDPWVAFTVRRINVPLGRVTHAFALPNRAAGSSVERLVVDLYGAMDLPATPDHSVRLLLNGQVVAQRQFDGFKREVFSVDLPAGLLQNSGNELAVELVADTQAASDIVMVESIRVDYLADLVAGAEGLSFDADAGLPTSPTLADTIFGNGFTEAATSAAACTASEPGCRVYEIRGVTTEPQLLRRRADGRVDQLTAFEHDPGPARCASPAPAPPATATCWCRQRPPWPPRSRRPHRSATRSPATRPAT